MPAMHPNPCHGPCLPLRQRPSSKRRGLARRLGGLVWSPLLFATACVAPPADAEILGAPAQDRDGGGIWPLAERSDAGADATAERTSFEADDRDLEPNREPSPESTAATEAIGVEAEGPDVAGGAGGPGQGQGAASPAAVSEVTCADGGLDGGFAAPTEEVTTGEDGGPMPSMTDPVPGALPDEGGAMPRVPAAGDLVIVELMPNPAHRTDAEGEWVELWNASRDELDLAACALGDDTDAGVAFPPVVIGEGRSFVAARSATPGFAPDAVLRMSLHNTADAVVVRCAGVVVDRVAYGPDLEWLVAAGVSLSLDPDAFDADLNDDPALWCRGVEDFGGDLGTPGGGNPPCEP